MIDMRIRRLFFDRPKVKRAVDAGVRKALSKAGAFIRQRARTSIRKRKGSSKPGQPPHSHVGLLRRFILFGFDPGRQSLVIGPVKLNTGTNAPRTLEHGGTTTILRRRKSRLTRAKVKIAPRPFMGPALDKERHNIPEAFRGSVNDG